MKVVSYGNYDLAIRRAVQKRLDETGSAPSEATVGNHVHCIQMLLPIEKKMEVDDDWREQIKDFVKNYEIKEV